MYRILFRIHFHHMIHMYTVHALEDFSSSLPTIFLDCLSTPVIHKGKLYLMAQNNLRGQIGSNFNSVVLHVRIL